MCTMHNPFKTRQRLYLTGTTILIVILILYKGLDIIIYWNTPCHYSEAGDALPSVDDPSFSPKEKSIFFHETSCRGGLTIRQACSVEAAARAHPKREIYVLFSSPVTDYTLKTSCLAKLLQFPNVIFLRIHMAKYSKGTILQSLLLKVLRESKFPIQHSADILRILTLNKWGGIYLDTDMIVTRSLEQLPSNFVAKENLVDVASGILSFAKDEIGTNVTNEVIKEIRNAYHPTHWSTIGAEAIEEVLRRLCPKVVRSPAYQEKPINNCKGVTIFDYELFYPHYYTEIDDIFKPASEDFDLARPYTYHMWSFLSHNRTIYEDTVYDLVAKAFCPTIHSTYRDEFSAKVINQSTIRVAEEATPIN